MSPRRARLRMRPAPASGLGSGVSASGYRQPACYIIPGVARVQISNTTDARQLLIPRPLVRSRRSFLLKKPLCSNLQTA